MKNTHIAIVCTLISAFSWNAFADTSTTQNPTTKSAVVNSSSNPTATKTEWADWCTNHPVACKDKWCVNHPVECQRRWCANHPRECR